MNIHLVRLRTPLALPYQIIRQKEICRLIKIAKVLDVFAKSLQVHNVCTNNFRNKNVKPSQESN